MRKRTEDSEKNRLKGPLYRRFLVDAARDRKKSVVIETDAAEREAVAGFLRLVAITALEAEVEVIPLSRGRYEVRGNVRARIVQNCVVSLEDFETRLKAPIEVLFAPQAVPARGRPRSDEVIEVSLVETEDDPPEAIINGAIDLGAVVVEFLALVLEPYPRKPGVDFDALHPQGLNSEGEPVAKVSPFARLAGLKAGGEPDK